MAGMTEKKHSALRLVSVVLFVVLALAAFVGCNGETANESSVAAESKAESVGEGSASLLENSSEAQSNTESSDVNTESSSVANESENAESSLPEEESSEASGEESIEPEILGTGTKDDPYLLIPDENQRVNTYNIPAGESQFYSIYRVGGTVLTIEDEKAAVNYEGKSFTAKNGKVSVEIEYALASDAILFEIKNVGKEEAAFVLQFKSPEGTMANPQKVTDVSANNEVSIPAGNETGYHFIYTAEKDGTLRFYMESSVAGVLSVTNNTTSANRTSEETEEEYVELEVKKGDELIIVVGAQRDKRNKIPAVDISWNAVYA